MPGMEKVEFEFPDEQEAKGKSATVEVEDDTDIEIEVVDDTPPADRGRKPLPVPPSEVTDEELSEYSEKVQSRIKHFSRGYHDERRAKESAQREREEAIKVAQQMAAANKAMEERLKALQEEQNKYAVAAAEAAKVDAQRRVKAAYEAGDADALVSANEELAKAVMREVSATKVAETPVQPETPVIASQSQTTQVPVDERAEAWQRENKWFGADDEMTSFALGLHNKLLKQGISPRSNEYYERINARMRQVFPENFESETTTEEPEPKPEGKPKKAPVVAPATRSTAPRKVKLSASQVAIAKRLGLPLELYAKQVAEDMRKQNG